MSLIQLIQLQDFTWILQIQIIIKMRRTDSEMVKNNHSLNRKQSPYSLHSSTTDSVAKPRKMSTTSLKQNIPDLEKLIMDIKISPSPDPNSENIKLVYKALKQLESNSLIYDEVHAVFLLMQSIQNKLSLPTRQKLRLPKINLTEHSQQKELSEVSPIKQISEQVSSRILYTNFSLKEIQKSINQQSSLMSQNKKNSARVAVSKFEEQDNNQQMQKLNNEILYLEKLLEGKTKGGSKGLDNPLFKKKLCRY